MKGHTTITVVLAALVIKYVHTYSIDYWDCTKPDKILLRNTTIIRKITTKTILRPTEEKEDYHERLELQCNQVHIRFTLWNVQSPRPGANA